MSFIPRDMNASQPPEVFRELSLMTASRLKWVLVFKGLKLGPLSDLTLSYMVKARS